MIPQGLATLMAAVDTAPLSNVALFSSTAALLGPAGQVQHGMLCP